MNTLFCGDNLNVLRQHVADASVDLVYLDPPFQSGRDYNLIFEPRGEERGEQRARAEAFKDTWKWGPEAARTYAELEATSGRPATALRSLRAMLGESDIMAYLCMMAPRLLELRRVLKKSGSLYLHSDPTASHYLKVLLDSIFGAACFRNEVIWRYRRWPAKAHRFQRMHDVLLYYTASPGKSHTFNTLYGYEKLAESTLKTFGKKKQRADFSSGHRKPRVEDVETEGPPLSDFWDVHDVGASGSPMSDAWEVGVIAAIGKERTGYPTQKPEALLERVILASSSPGDVVLDPFCGCGTAVAVAERFGRRWIGIDVEHMAIAIIRERMKGAVFNVRGQPHDRDSAKQLAKEDPYGFVWWILGHLGARPRESSGRKSGADSGIDGDAFFRDDPRAPPKRIVFSVKGGKTGPGHVRELRAVIDRENAAIGVLLTMQEPTQAMIGEAAKAGLCESVWGRHPKLQIITVDEILEGHRVDCPGASPVGLKKARRAPQKPERMRITLRTPSAQR